jgi:hypothetical protein
MFADTVSNDYHLTEDSPCIDAGDPSSPLDPDGTIADMGAFYYDQSICGDANGDDSMSPSDGYLILNYFGSGPQPASCWAANVNGDDGMTSADGFYLLNYIGDPISWPLNCQPCEF